MGTTASIVSSVPLREQQHQQQPPPVTNGNVGDDGHRHLSTASPYLSSARKTSSKSPKSDEYSRRAPQVFASLRDHRDWVRRKRRQLAALRWDKERPFDKSAARCGN